MFPPERTATTGPLPPTRSASSAATGAAPAPSTTSFVRSSRRTIAWLISSSLTTTMSSSTSRRIDEVSSPGCLTAIPSAIVKPPTSRPASGANAADCTPTSRAFGFAALIASAMPDASPPPPIGMITVSRSGTCSSSSSPIVPWPAITCSSSKAWRNVTFSDADVVERGRERLLERLAVKLRLRAVVPRRLDLRHRRVMRHEDAGERARLAGGPGDRLAVVAGARGDDAGGVLLRAQLGDLVDRAADLEGAGALEVLRLQVDGRARSAARTSPSCRPE